MLRNSTMLVCEKKNSRPFLGLRKNSDCGAVGIMCKEAVPNGAEEVLSGQCDKAAWSCSGLFFAFFNLEEGSFQMLKYIGT